VIYMGVRGLRQLCARLVEHGLPASTPAALVEKATLPRQRVVAGTLETLPSLAEREQMRPPALVIVGEVVTLRDKLGWYRPRALDAEQPAAEDEPAAR